MMKKYCSPRFLCGLSTHWFLEADVPFEREEDDPSFGKGVAAPFLGEAAAQSESTMNSRSCTFLFYLPLPVVEYFSSSKHTMLAFTSHTPWIPFRNL